MDQGQTLFWPDRGVEMLARSWTGEGKSSNGGSTSLLGLQNNVLCTWAVDTGLLGAGTRDRVPL